MAALRLTLALAALCSLGAGRAWAEEERAVATLRTLAAQLAEARDARALAERLGTPIGQMTLAGDRVLENIQPRQGDLRLLELLYRESGALSVKQRTPEMLGVNFAGNGGPTLGALRQLAGKRFALRQVPAGRILRGAVAFPLGDVVVDLDLVHPELWAAADTSASTVPVTMLRLYRKAAAAEEGVYGGKQEGGK